MFSTVPLTLPGQRPVRIDIGKSARKELMRLKTATLIALIGVGASYGMRLVQSVQYHAFGMHLIQDTLFNVSLIIFLFTLYRNQK